MEQLPFPNVSDEDNCESDNEVEELCPLGRDNDGSQLGLYTTPTDHPDDDIPLLQLAQLVRNRSKLPMEGSDFQPLQIDRTRCVHIGRPNNESLRNRHRHTPDGIFKMFFPRSVLNAIAANTNAYAKKQNAGIGRPWYDVTAMELQCFFCICLYMRVFSCPQVKDYWDKSLQTPKFPFITAMSLVRFEQIKRCIHITDPNAKNNGSYFFEKIEPLLSHFVSTCKKLWIPSTFLSVDEMMVMCHGRSSETVRMRNKPISCGFKIWSVCDSGYLYFAFPHSNKDLWREAVRYKGKLTHSSSVVARLCEELPGTFGQTQASKPILYVIFMDNYFASTKLFKLLREREIGAFGTVRSDAQGFPKQLAIRGSQLAKRLEWDTLGTGVCQEGMVLAMAWIDNGPVQMLSTVHKIRRDYTIMRSRKRPRLTSTNGRRVRAVFGDKAVKTLPIPKIVDDFNYKMGGVDIADQLRSVYTCHMPSRGTWMPLFFWLLDTAVTNSYLVLSKLDGQWVNRQKYFKISLAISLISEYTSQVLLEVRLRRKFTTDRSRDSYRMPKGGTGLRNYVTKNCVGRGLQVGLNGYHLPVRVSAKDRRRCYYCRMMAKRGGNDEKSVTKTAFKCAACGHFLCVDESQNCFLDMHQEAFHQSDQ